MSPTARLVLVGDGPDRAALESTAPPGVQFIGARNDVDEFLAAADVVALPSRWESTPLVSLEAMAAGPAGGRLRGRRRARRLGDTGVVLELGRRHGHRRGRWRTCWPTRQRRPPRAGRPAGGWRRPATCAPGSRPGELLTSGRRAPAELPARLHRPASPRADGARHPRCRRTGGRTSPASTCSRRAAGRHRAAALRPGRTGVVAASPTGPTDPGPPVRPGPSGRERWPRPAGPAPGSRRPAGQRRRHRARRGRRALARLVATCSPARAATTSWSIVDGGSTDGSVDSAGPAPRLRRAGGPGRGHLRRAQPRHPRGPQRGRRLHRRRLRPGARASSTAFRRAFAVARAAGARSSGVYTACARRAGAGAGAGLLPAAVRGPPARAVRAGSTPGCSAPGTTRGSPSAGAWRSPGRAGSGSGGFPEHLATGEDVSFALAVAAARSRCAAATDAGWAGVQRDGRRRHLADVPGLRPRQHRRRGPALLVRDGVRGLAYLVAPALLSRPPGAGARGRRGRGLPLAAGRARRPRAAGLAARGPAAGRAGDEGPGQAGRGRAGPHRAPTGGRGDPAAARRHAVAGAGRRRAARRADRHRARPRPLAGARAHLRRRPAARGARRGRGAGRGGRRPPGGARGVGGRRRGRARRGRARSGRPPCRATTSWSRWRCGSALRGPAAVPNVWSGSTPTATSGTAACASGSSSAPPARASPATARSATPRSATSPTSWAWRRDGSRSCRTPCRCRRAPPPPPPGPPTVLMAAAMRADKDHALVLRAWPAVLARHPAPGSGWPATVPAAPTRAARRRARDRRPRRVPRVRDDVDALLAGAHLLVLASYAVECFPYAALEAMAAGRGVVSTNVAGLPEMVEDGVTGRLVPPRDPDALARALVEGLTTGPRPAQRGARPAGARPGAPTGWTAGPTAWPNCSTTSPGPAETRAGPPPHRTPWS